MKTQEDLGVSRLDYMPCIRGGSNVGERFKGSGAGVTTWLNLKDERSSAARPDDLIVRACQDTLGRVDGQLRKGSGDGRENNEESHG